MATKRNRIWAFTTTGDSQRAGFWTRFLTGSKPTQATLEDVLESIPFFKETTSAASIDNTGAIETKQGLVIISSDVNNKSGSNTPLGSSGGILAVSPSGLPNVVPGSGLVDTINNNISNFTTVALNVTIDGTVTTKNSYIVTLSTNFKNWLTSVLNSINASLGTLATSISTNATNITNNTNSINTLNTEVASLIANSGDIYEASSSSTNTIGLGSLSFEVPAGCSYGKGNRIRFTDNASSVNFVEGVVTSYTGTTLVVTVDFTGGSGSKSLWNVNLGSSYEKYNTTSTSGVLISFGTATKTFTVETNLAYKQGQRVHCSQVGTPSTFLEGVISSYTASTGVLIIIPDSMGGAGYGTTISSWNISLGGLTPLTTSISTVVPTFTSGVAPTLSSCILLFTRVGGMIYLSFSIVYTGGSGSYDNIIIPLPIGLRAFASNFYGRADCSSSNSLVLKALTSGNNINILAPAGGTVIPSGSNTVSGFIIYPYE